MLSIFFKGFPVIILIESAYFHHSVGISVFEQKMKRFREPTQLSEPADKRVRTNKERPSLARGNEQVDEEFDVGYKKSKARLDDRRVKIEIIRRS